MGKLLRRTVDLKDKKRVSRVIEVNGMAQEEEGGKMKTQSRTAK